MPKFSGMSDPHAYLRTVPPVKRKVDHEDSNIDLGFGPDNKRGRVIAAERDQALRSRSTISPPQTPRPRLMTTATVPSTWPGLEHVNDRRMTIRPTSVAPKPSTVRNERPSTAWSIDDDALLMRLRAQGLNWAPIARDHFPKKTPNACRKRHERLMEKLNQEKWDDGVKLEVLAREYSDARELMRKVIAEKVGKKWQHVENKCMEKGLKTLTSAARSRRNEDSPYWPRTPHDEDDDFHDSGLAPDPVGSDAGNPDPQSGSWFPPKFHQAHAFADVPNEVLSAAKPTPLDAIQDIQKTNNPELNHGQRWGNELEYDFSTPAHSTQTLHCSHDKLLADHASLQNHCERMDKKLDILHLQNKNLSVDRQRLQKCVDSLNVQSRQSRESEAHECSVITPENYYDISQKVDDSHNELLLDDRIMGNSRLQTKAFGREDDIDALSKKHNELSKQRDQELTRHRKQELAWQIERDLLLAQIETHYQSRKLHFPLVPTDNIVSFVKSLLFSGVSETLRRLWNNVFDVDSSSACEEGLKRLSWTCGCGYKSFDYFQELRPGAVADYESFLYRRLRKQANPDHTGPGNIASLALRSVARSLNLVQSTPSTSDEERQDLSSSDAEPSQVDSSDTSVSSATTTSGSLYLLLCLPYKTRGTKLVQPDLEKIQSDQDFFLLLKSCYSEIRGKPRSMLSLRTPRKIRFVQFELRRSQLVNIRRDNDIPPENYKNDYIYKPMPAEMIPPLGENYMMHLYAHPDHADASAASDLEQVPKKLKERLCVGNSEGKGIGWGVQFIEAWHYNLIWLLSFAIVVLASFVFFVCWAVLEHDVQGASGVAAYVLALATLSIGSVQAAFEMEIL